MRKGKRRCRGRRKKRRRRRRRARGRLRRRRRWRRQQRRERREREKKRHHINRTTPKIDDAQVGGGGRAVKKVGNGVAGVTAFRAKRDVGKTGSGAVSLEETTMARAKLGEGASLATRKSGFGVMDGRRARVKERVRAERIDDGGDGVFVDRLDSVTVGGGRHNAIGKKRVDDVRILRKERVL